MFSFKKLNFLNMNRKDDTSLAININDNNITSTPTYINNTPTLNSNLNKLDKLENEKSNLITRLYKKALNMIKKETFWLSILILLIMMSYLGFYQNWLHFNYHQLILFNHSLSVISAMRVLFLMMKSKNNPKKHDDKNMISWLFLTISIVLLTNYIYIPDEVVGDFPVVPLGPVNNY